MRTGKKLISILLILLMGVFLFAGCGKKEPEDTTLEGTWRVIKEIEQSIYKEKGEDGEPIIIEEDESIIEYPVPMEIEGDGYNIAGTSFFYFKFDKNNIYQEYLSIKIEGYVSPQLKAEYPIIDELLEGLILKWPYEAEYSATENKILITITYYDEEEDEQYIYEEEYSYVIDGKKMIMTQVDIDDECWDEDGQYWEDRETIELVKVNNSAVAGAKNLNDYDESEFPPFLFGGEN